MLVFAYVIVGGLLEPCQSCQAQLSQMAAQLATATRQLLFNEQGLGGVGIAVYLGV